MSVEEEQLMQQQQEEIWMLERHLHYARTGLAEVIFSKEPNDLTKDICRFGLDRSGGWHPDEFPEQNQQVKDKWERWNRDRIDGAKIS